ncbi:bifunctional protein FolD protein [Clostridium tepidiprofundi DSM 19306]|uniref:Bifunctional protein FolD n=1 Tax=Clostridium tepidiprofundi DSM 19306 TaxID=1121338 RepID=A0A151B6Z5_9CLOT|nr:bifunctional protein FolD protein [Clostridium tepidiprofundi DSM 19306]
MKVGTILSGIELANEYKKKIREIVYETKEKGIPVPCLAAVLVGNDGGSEAYVKNQKRVCEKLGVEHKLISFDNDVTEEELLNTIDELNNDVNINGIIIQFPLPKHINAKHIIKKILPSKDVDGLTELNFARLYKGERCFTPCTSRAVLELINKTGINIEGKHAVVVGRSDIIGKPVALLLLRNNATVTICHSKTRDLIDICKNADILISCIGKPGIITKDYVKKGAIVIDVGTTRVDGKIRGDVDFEEVKEIASYITPVPGGVGSVTTTMLIMNTCDAFLYQEQKK